MDPKEKILTAAIELMSQKGEITVREVTEKAGVNVAAINYHFGNKNNLLKMVEEHFANVLYEYQAGLFEGNDKTPKEKIIDWAHGLMEYMLKFPAIVPLIVSLANDNRDYSPKIIEKIYMNNEIMINVCTLIAMETNCFDRKKIGFKYTQIFSGIVGPILNELLNNLYFKGAESQFSTEENRREYVVDLVNSILR